MPKSYYLPSDDAGKGAWLNNLNAKLPSYFAALGLTAADTASVAADAAFFGYCLSSVGQFPDRSMRSVPPAQATGASRPPKWHCEIRAERGRAGNLLPALPFENLFSFTSRGAVRAGLATGPAGGRRDFNKDSAGRRLYILRHAYGRHLNLEAWA